MAIIQNYFLSGRLFGILVFWLYAITGTAASVPESKQLRLIVTSDLHGWMSTALIYPNDKRKGLLHLAQGIKKARSENPDLILLDAGDLLQGSPLVSYIHQTRKTPSAEDPFFKLFQSLRYNAVVVGNHDLGINPIFEKEYLPVSEFSWLAANIYRNNKRVFKPFVIIYRNGLKIIVLGFSTPGSQMWLGIDQLSGITFRPIEESAAYWLKLINREEKPDLIIGVFHAGMYPVRDDENSKLNRISAANSVTETIIQNSLFDLVIAGHDHHLSPRYKGSYIRYIKKTPVIEGGRWGEAYVDLKLKLLRSKNKWKISHIKHNTHQASQNSKIDSAYIRGLPDDYKNYLQESLPYIMIRSDKQQTSLCLNQLNAMAQTTPKIFGTMLPKLSLSRLSDLNGRHLQRIDLYKWFRYDNRAVTVLMSLREFQLLSNPIPEFGRRRISYNRVLYTHLNAKIPAQKQPTWWLDSEPFRKRVYVKISDYHYFGGGGIIQQIFFPKNQKVEISKQVLRDRFFEYLKKRGPNLPEACNFMRYTGI